MHEKFFFKYTPYILLVTVSALHLAGYLASVHIPRGGQWAAWLAVTFIDALFAMHCGMLLHKQRKSIYRDNLTGLNNRGYIYLKLIDEMENSKRRNLPISLAIIDVDNFKNINDTFGHPSGDKVLMQLVAIFKQNIRSYDTIGRLGGDEFVIILPRTDMDGAYRIAERIRSAVEAHSFSSGDMAIKSTISIGVTAIEDMMEVDRFIELADKAMYKAKERKNLVAVVE